MFTQHACGRLLLIGQDCTCQQRAPRACDCTHDGNTEHRGAACIKRERDAWNNVIGKYLNHKEN